MDKITIVSNARPIELAEPVSENEHVAEVITVPIVAWRIAYNDHDEELSFAVPISIEPKLPTEYAIYNSEDTSWMTRDGDIGKGLTSLLVHYQEKFNT